MQQAGSEVRKGESQADYGGEDASRTAFHFRGTPRNAARYVSSNGTFTYLSGVRNSGMSMRRRPTAVGSMYAFLRCPAEYATRVSGSSGGRTKGSSLNPLQIAA